MATILNTGASRDGFLQQALRHILMTAARHQFMIKAKHIRGIDNRIPDWLSRWHMQDARRKFRSYAREKSLKRTKIDHTLVNLPNIW